tara:strand:+ start:96 stop:569 length:474 start_codon:yes stop_codon:yes gene_type:complete
MSFFELDLQTGKDAEHVILACVQKTYPKAFAIEGSFKAYDLFVPEISAGVEVKVDSMAHKTGNVFIEVSLGGKPSGLMVTLAMYWAYVTNDEVIWFKPERVKDCIVQTNPPMQTYVGGNGFAQGDETVKEAYLLKRSTLVPYAERVTPRGVQAACVL